MKYHIYNRTSGTDMGVYEGECREDAIRAMVADGDSGVTVNDFNDWTSELAVEYYSDKDAFDRIMGDCAGVDTRTLTEKDVRDMATVWAEQHEECSAELVLSAVRGLKEYQAEE